MYAGAVSLLANKSSALHVLPASTIPQGPAEIPTAPWQSTPNMAQKPSAAETEYVALSGLHRDEMILPSTEEFQARTVQAMNVKNKFSLLKDVQAGGFYNILGRIIKTFDGSTWVTVYLSDYTANTHFYDYPSDLLSNKSVVGERDEYGNNKSTPQASKDWPGPYGKLTIQLTLFEAHAEFIREHVKEPGEWLLLKNVHIKESKMGKCWEGYLRGDPNQFEGEVRVEIMKEKEDRDENDDRWKEAVRRKLEWEKKYEKQKKAFLDEATKLGEKRKGEDEPLKNNSKHRRKERLRAKAMGKGSILKEEIAEQLNLNENGWWEPL
jgi:hypothetical protein